MKKFNSIITSNKNILICYFYNGFRSSIKTQVDKYFQELDIWNKAIKQVINIETKASCQTLSKAYEIYSQYLKGYKSIKNDK